MAYVNYTSCVSVDKHRGLFANVGAGGLVAVATAVAMLASGLGVVPGLAIPALMLVIAYCRWWLYDRLICLGGDRCAIGLLASVEPPEKKTGLDAFDTDYSINLVLVPHAPLEQPVPFNPGTPPPLTNPVEWQRKKLREARHHVIADDGLQGDLISEQDLTAKPKTITGAKRFDFEGYFTKMGFGSVVHHHQPVLHAEFEGGGVMRLYEAALAALALATAAAVACAIPVFGWIVCALLNLAAAVVTVAGIVIALNDKGDPAHVNPQLGTLHSSRDILLVKGRWVFDTAHEGWNELHPIIHCQRVGEYDVQVCRATCGAIGSTRSADGAATPTGRSTQDAGATGRARGMDALGERMVREARSNAIRRDPRGPATSSEPMGDPSRGRWLQAGGRIALMPRLFAMAARREAPCAPSASMQRLERPVSSTRGAFLHSPW